jgi:PAS domain S-box-containing protein
MDRDTLAFKDGRVFERYSCPMTKKGVRIGRVWSFRDITEGMRADRFQNLSITVLKILNNPLALPEMIGGVLAAIKTATGFSAVGVRLKSGDDFPFFAQIGFPKDFLLTENTLIYRKADGSVSRDKDGQVNLECTCGLVLSGRTDPANPLFTSGGSFWTSNSMLLADLPADQDLRFRPRNRCIHVGYGSVALIPILDDQQIVGLLQLNNRQTDSLSLDMVRFFEGISASIGMALMQKRIEAALRESESRYQGLIHLAVDGILLGSKEGLITDANECMCTLVGQKREDLIGKPIRDFPADPENPTRTPPGLELLQKGEIITHEHTLIRPDQSRVVVEMRTKRMPDGTYQSIFRDITKHKTTEESLRLKNLVFDEAITANSIAGLDGVITEANAMLLRLWGYTSKAEVVGKPIPHFLHDPKEATAIVTALDQSGQWEGSYTARRKDGSTFTAYGMATVVRAENGEIVGYQSSVIDITERVKAETEIRKLQKLTSIGTLAGGIAHDFNNLLTGLFGNIALAKVDIPRDHPGHQRLEEAEQCMDRAIRLTNQLLTFSKGGDPVKQDVNLGSLFREGARSVLAGSKVTLDFQQAEDLWLAKVDTSQIQQVVSALLVNACEAMPDGGGLYISLENAFIPEPSRVGSRPGKYIRVTVRDEGMGVSQKHLEQIFDPYFTTKRAGRGLGLATAHSIINKHGGHINVISETGMGTTFTLYLPASESLSQRESKPTDQKTPPTHRAARVLLMDDEVLICNLVTKMLEHEAFSVATAPGGHEAIEMYRQAREAGEPFDVVIMDLTIPGGMGGKEAIKSLLALDPNARAIVSSGYADDPVMARHAEYGFIGRLAKPYTKNALCELLGQVLQK